MSITYVTGDVIASVLPDSYKVIPHICNDSGGWGHGFVMAISRKWKGPENKYREWDKSGYYVRNDKKILFELGSVQLVKVEENVVVANMIAQHKTVSKDNPRPIKYDALIECMQQVRDRCLTVLNSGKKVEIHAPMFGAGLAQGNWKVIEQLIIEFWVNASIPVTIYEFQVPL